MNSESRFHRNSGHIGSDVASFCLIGGLFPALQTDSSYCPVNYSLSDHPQVAQGEQCYQLRRVLGQTLVANLGEAKLALDDSEWVFDFGSDTGLELFGLVQQVAPRRILLQCPAFARAHGYVPGYACGFLSFLCSLIASIGKDYSFFSVQQSMALGHVVDVGRCANDAVHQSRVSIHPDMNTKGLPASR